MDVSQGKLVIGLDVNLSNDEQKYFTLLYNSLLGGSAIPKCKRKSKFGLCCFF